MALNYDGLKKWKIVTSDVERPAWFVKEVGHKERYWLQEKSDDVIAKRIDKKSLLLSLKNSNKVALLNFDESTSDTSNRVEYKIYNNIEEFVCSCARNSSTA